jgi:hypothetical protein
MLATSLLMLAIAATGFAEVPVGYSTVYITSNVDATFAVVPKAATNGSTTVVLVSQCKICAEHSNHLSIF